MMASLSRQLAQWVVSLRYDDLPPEVFDRAKRVTLHSLASVLLGSQLAGGQQAAQLIRSEEAGVRRGASIMVHGTTVTKGGAAFANSEMAMPAASWTPSADAEAGVRPAQPRGSQVGEALMSAFVMIRCKLLLAYIVAPSFPRIRCRVVPIKTAPVHRYRLR
jgi:hypothetical protein